MLQDVYAWLIDESPQLLVAALLVGGSVILWRATSCWPARVQLLGAASHLGYTLVWGFSAYMAPYALTHPESSFARLIYPTDTEHPAFKYIYLTLRLISICFPVGLLLSALWIRKHLTKRSSQPLTGA
jgi:hypothetical protein